MLSHLSVRGRRLLAVAAAASSAAAAHSYRYDNPESAALPTFTEDEVAEHDGEDGKKRSAVAIASRKDAFAAHAHSVGVESSS